MALWVRYPKDYYYFFDWTVDGPMNSETHQDKIVVVDNVIVQQRIGKKYKKYHINAQDPSGLSCPQVFIFFCFIVRMIYSPYLKYTLIFVTAVNNVILGL